MVMIDPHSGNLKQDSELEAIFEQAGVNLQADTVVSCMTGTTACIVELAMRKVGA